MSAISGVAGCEILDSRGNPTVEDNGSVKIVERKQKLNLILIFICQID